MSVVSEFVAANRGRYLAELMELLRYPSIEGDRAGLAGAAEWIAQRMTRLGAQVRLLQTGDGPPVIFGELGQGAHSLLSYTHYDVQPPDPLDEWLTPPFEPTVSEGKLYARGTCDDKGDTVARLQAVDVYRSVYGDLPLRLKYFVEGEEEVGSPHLEAVAAEHRQLLRSDGAIWEGGGFDESERYVLYCGVKGIQYVELHVRGAAYDLHSSFAPMVANPAWRLVEALNTLKNERDEIEIDDFMEHVRPPSETDLDEIRRIPFPGDQMKVTWGIGAFINGMTDEQAFVRYLTAPTCTICGLRSGFIDEGPKTVLPATAMAKLDFRLVPDLTPNLVVDLLRKHLNRRGFFDIEIRRLAGMVGMRSDLRAPVVQTAVQTASAVYGAEPVVYPSIGGSGPMHALVGAVETPGVVMVGLTYSGMRMHSPNENIRLDDYFRHLEFLVEFMRRFAAA